MGRRRLPPAPAMYPPISWISATGEASSRRISASTARNSSPTRAETRSLRTRSSVGVGTRARYFTTTRSRTWTCEPAATACISATEKRSRVSVIRAVADFLVELAEHLAGDGMDDRDAVARRLTMLPGRRPSALVRSMTIRLVST